MASYNELNALIDAYINRNGVQAITGQILNGVLKAMVEQLGRGYTIMGAATPTTDPGTPDAPECYFASETGTYTDFDGLQVVPGELALLCYTPSDGWTKNTIYEGFQTVGATIDGNVGTPSVGVSYANGVLSFDFHNMKGNPGQNGQDGDPAGFGTIGADITGGVGTPGVTVESSGPATAKNLQFHFTNLKGETGVTSVVATVDNTTGTPACTVSLVGQQLTLAFSGLKGAQGNTGVSADYPIAIINNLTTDDPASALSAAQGVVLDGKVSQLEAKIDDIATGKFYGYHPTVADLPEGDVPGFAYVGTESPYSIYNFDGTTWTDSGATVKRGEGQIIYLEDSPGYASDLSPVAMREFLQSAIDYVGEKKAMLVFPKGETFVVDIPEAHTTTYDCEGGDGLQIPSDIIIDFNYSTIKADTNHWWTYNILHILPTSKNVIVKNGHIVGDRDTHIMSYTISSNVPAARTDEGHTCIRTHGPGNDQILNMVCTDIRGDGISVEGSCAWNHTLAVNGANILAGQDVNSSGALVSATNYITTTLLTISTYFTTQAHAEGLKTFLTPRTSLDRSVANKECSYYLKISYYTEADVFISSETIMMGDPMNIPSNATKFRLTQWVADTADTFGFWIMNTMWNETSLVRGCEVTRCGRNGILPTVCRSLVIEQCNISNIYGTDNNVAIDIEGTSYVQRDIYIRDCIISNDGYHGIIVAQGERIFIERCILNGCGIGSRGNSVHIFGCKAKKISHYFSLNAVYDTDLVYEKSVIRECEVLGDITAVYAFIENCKCNTVGSYQGYEANTKVKPIFRGCQATIVKAAMARYEDCEIISTDNNAVNIQFNQVEFVRCKFRVPRFATGGTAVIRCEGCEIVGYVSGNDGLGFQTDYFVNNHIITESPNGTIKLNFKPVGKVCRIEKNTYEGQYYYLGVILTKASLAVAEIVTLKDNTFLCSATGAGTLFKVNAQLKDCKIYAERNVISASGNWVDFNIDASILATDKLKVFTDGNMQVGGGTFTEITDSHISRLTWTPSVTP